MRIAIISYPYLRWFGGAERYVDELSKFLVRHDNEVTIVASKMAFSRGRKREVKHCKVKEIETYFMPGKIPKSYLENELFTKKCESYLRKHGYEFDVINGQAINALPAILSEHYHKKPVICTTYNTPWRRVSREQEIEIYHRAAGIIVLTEFEKRTLIEKYKIDGDKIQVIYVGVDVDRFNYKRYSGQVNALKASLGHEDKMPFIFTLQRMDARKDISFLIGALKGFVDRYHIPVYVGGSGPRLNEVKVLLEGYESNIKLLGYIDDDYLPLYYSAADIFISATWGQVVFESMACETANILINDHPNAAEYLEDGQDGYLVDKNSSIFIDKLGYLVENKEVVTRFKNNGLKKIINRFSWEKHIQEILDFYHRYV